MNWFFDIIPQTPADDQHNMYNLYVIVKNHRHQNNNKYTQLWEWVLVQGLEGRVVWLPWRK